MLVISKKSRIGLTYNFKQATEKLKISAPGGKAYVGRNNILAILRSQDILDFENQPYEKYIRGGYFIVGESFRTPIINGDRGLRFVESLINDYLKKYEKR